MTDGSSLIRILAVDDHPLLRNGVVGLVAEHPDMKVVAEASNGLEAIQQFRIHHPDITLMDLHMPEMNGMEATARIREKEKITGGHQPIVALTAHAMKGDQELCLAAGMDGYLAKPIRAQELDQILDQLAGRGAAIVK